MRYRRSVKATLRGLRSSRRSSFLRLILPLHLGDDFVSLLDESGQEVLLVYGAHDLALAEDDAPALASGDAQVRHSGFAGPVHDAAHDGYGDGLPQALEVLL